MRKRTIAIEAARVLTFSQASWGVGGSAISAMATDGIVLALQAPVFQPVIQVIDAVEPGRRSE
ncbi:hypothetical protein, partial [Roseovarius sp. D22-M7]|uniref:hypothetical protein n=1 Tax=Roseovarius sp. D22-M7 TaxID=3127116 RepID=UPI00300F9714